jgi:iron(III) transport system substrate-binding protein
VKTKKLSAMLMAGVASAALLTGCGEDAPTASASTIVGDDIDAICEAGKEEGPIQRWASASNDLYQEMIKPFTDKYGIEVEFTEVDPGGITPRLLAEKQAGRPFTPDVVEGFTIDLTPLLNDDYLQKIDWEAAPFNVPADKLTQGTDIPGLRIFRTFSGISYNTDKLDESEVPSTFEELIDAKWAGRINVQPNGAYFAHLPNAEVMGMEGARKWFDQFMEVSEPIPLHGGTAGLQAVAAGQIDISSNATFDKVQEFLAEADAPIGFKYLDYVNVADSAAYIVKGSPRSNAAACYLNWWGSQEAADIRYEYEFKTNDTEPADLPEGSKLVPLNTIADIGIADDFTGYVSEYFLEAS